ncbi:MAG: GNAT family N-acetyltransferase [Rhizobiaceae bacterium]
MSIQFSFVPELTDKDEFEHLMVGFFEGILIKLDKVGGPAFRAEDLARKSASRVVELTPQTGRILLAHNQSRELVGCGILRLIRPDAAELKHMYVHPAAQGLGLGKQLLDMRIAEAEKMGCIALYADTVKGNTKMLSMYERRGFEYIDRYPENANTPDLAPYMVYLERKFDQS